MNIRELFLGAVALFFLHCAMQMTMGAPELSQRAQNLNKLEEMRRTMSVDIFPYMNLDEAAPDPSDPSLFIEFLTETPWNHGMPRQLLEVVSVDPTHFAPAIRERLMRLPPTLEEYELDQTRVEHRYSTSSSRNTRPHGPESGQLLSVISYLDREHAEPILREFADRLIELQEEAEESLTALPEDDHNERQRLNTLARSFARLRLPAIGAARKLHSPMFVEEGIETLERMDRIADTMGQNGLVAYLAEFADERPDLYRRMKTIADRFESVRTSHERALTFMVKRELERIDARD